jgi:exodeoxyribonuclease V alpha subunit
VIPVRATGLLRAFAEAGVLAEADVHVALRLARLGGESTEEVLLAVALAVRGVRTGSVCVELAEVAGSVVSDEDAPPVELAWPRSWDALQTSPLVAVGAQAPWRPLRLVDGLLYLDRYWQQEQRVRRELDERALGPAPTVDLGPLAALFPGQPAGGTDRQRLAAAVAATRWVSVVTGGPGTGKTHTVARLLRLLLDQGGPAPRIALCAPTGKAAARLQESVQEQAEELGLPAGLTASTLHRLLGWRPDSRSRFRHDARNHLPYDVIVVDESSMVSLTMMARLLEAVRPAARLVLVGDPDQLTPVEAGAVLSDLVHRPAPVAAGPPSTLEAGADGDLDEEERRQLRNGVVRLRVPHRFGSGIGALAEAVRAGDADRVLDLLHAGGEVTLTDDVVGLRSEVVQAAGELTRAAGAGQAEPALALLSRHRLLCAHRHGPYGVSYWNQQVARWSGAPARHAGQWPAGTPLLVTANDDEARLYNGDTGVVVQTPDGLRAAFARPGGAQLLPLSRLAAAQPVHAMTVHRSQGSQYDAVTVLLPTQVSAILTRELLYTAVTRARERVRVVGTDEAVRAAVERQVVRASGLRRVVGTAVYAAPGPSAAGG